jgi:choline dehydrogenase
MVPGVETFITACLENGIPMCLDNNSGNPVGVGLAQFNIGRGERSYAATAFLDPVRKTNNNLSVITNTSVDRILFEGKTARGVELYNNSTGDKGKFLICAWIIADMM